MAAVAKNRNFFNCPLLLAQILTAATWQGVVEKPRIYVNLPIVM
jgi:hypothetical protein